MYPDGSSWNNPATTSITTVTVSVPSNALLGDYTVSVGVPCTDCTTASYCLGSISFTVTDDTSGGPGKTRSPAVEGIFRNVVLAANIGDLLVAFLSLLQKRDDLLVRKLTLFHPSILFFSQNTHFCSGSVYGGQVIAYAT
jgi:hypothetical protein